MRRDEEMNMRSSFCACVLGLEYGASGDLGLGNTLGSRFGSFPLNECPILDKRVLGYLPFIFNRMLSYKKKSFSRSGGSPARAFSKICCNQNVLRNSRTSPAIVTSPVTFIGANTRDPRQQRCESNNPLTTLSSPQHPSLHVRDRHNNTSISLINLLLKEAILSSSR